MLQRAPYKSRRRTFGVFSAVMASVSLSPSAYAWVKVILFWVRVPVLSEQMTEVDPKVSTAGSFFTMAFRFAMRSTPMERTMVTITGSPSGMADTAKDTAVIKISITGMPPASPIRKMTAQITRAKAPMYFPNSASFCCRGVLTSLSPSSMPAILPIWVFMPVSVMMASAVP